MYDKKSQEGGGVKQPRQDENREKKQEKFYGTKKAKINKIHVSRFWSEVKFRSKNKEMIMRYEDPDQPNEQDEDGKPKRKVKILKTGTEVGSEMTWKPCNVISHN